MLKCSVPYFDRGETALRRTRLIRCILILVFCLCLMSTAVSAATSATDMNAMITVSADGRCQVSTTIRIHFAEPASRLTFPLPKDAQNVSVNGSSVRTYTSATDPDVVLADLSSLNGITGDYQLMFSYTLPDVIRTEQSQNNGILLNEGKLVMEIPLLSGFEYPVDALSFSVTMPGEVKTKPTFTSTYMQSSVESRINTIIGGQLINGSTTRGMQDREKVSLMMDVPEEMFPGKLLLQRTGNPEIIPMIGFGVLALIYWMIFMRTWPVFRHPRSTPIEGMTAGEMGCRLTAAGVDLTMMVFTWAQLGYLRILVDKKGRVILEKRMDMGNERGETENRAFRNLFGREDFVDATGVRYAKLCRSMEETVSCIKEMYTKRAGNVKIFRMLGCAISLFCGICFGMNMAKTQLPQVLLSILFATIGVVTAWGIQGAMYKIHVRGKVPLYIGSVCGLLWILISLLVGQWIMGLSVVAGQYLIGLMAAYGGRRSELGIAHAGDVLGLRQYLRKLDDKQVKRLLDNNPDYFFDMLPIAIALGVDTKFAKAFGKMIFPDCPYLLVTRNEKRTPTEWAYLIRKIADQMDKRQRKLELEKWIPINIKFY